MGADRIDAEQAYGDVMTGKALLVCAYDSDEKFREYHLPDAMSLAEFRKRADALPKNQEIIFYCS
jgi:rhodanese-related sulfurtransferase